MSSDRKVTLDDWLLSISVGFDRVIQICPMLDRDPFYISNIEHDPLINAVDEHRMSIDLPHANIG
jgi:hypothetical protein